MIPVLSKIYTETLGPWALPVFYAGAIFTLYGTIFAATAAHSRVFADMVRLSGGFRHDDYESRLRWRNRFVWMLTLVPVGFFLTFQSPVTMVKAGGFAQALMLPVIAAGSLFLRHRASPKEAQPGPAMTATLWIASISTIVLTLLSVLLSLQD